VLENYIRRVNFHFSLKVGRYLRRKILDYKEAIEKVSKASIKGNKIKEKKSLILAPHYSSLDWKIIDLLFENPPFYIVKYPLYLTELIGGIRVIRDKDLKEYGINKRYFVQFNKLSLKLAEEALNYTNLVIFPEGSRSDKPLNAKTSLIRRLSNYENVYFIGFDKEYNLIEVIELNNLSKEELNKLISKYKSLY